MRFFQTVAVCAASFATFVVAQSNNVGFTSTPASVKAGQVVTIKYSSNNLNNAVTITLRKGDPNDLQTIQTLTSSATGGSYNWAVPDYLENANDYALQIVQGNDVNYSGEFALTGANASAVSTASAATASLSSQGAALSSSIAQSMSISSIQAIIASYNSSLANLTSPATTTMANLTGTAASMGTGTAMIRNTTMSSATLTSGASTGASATSGGAGATGNTGGSSGSSGSSATTSGSSASATSSGAAAGVVTGGSPLALVLAAVAGMLI